MLCVVVRGWFVLLLLLGLFYALCYCFILLLQDKKLFTAV